MDWFSIENDDMVPTWLLGSKRKTPIANPNENDNMFPAWLKGSSEVKESGKSGGKDVATSTSKAKTGKEVATSTAALAPATGTLVDYNLETGDGRVAEFLLYYYPHSYYCQKTLMALYEKDVPFIQELVNINLGEQFRDEFLDLNPSAEVPVLKDLGKDVVVADSDLIAVYLEENYGPRLSRARKIIPEVVVWKEAHEEFQQKINSVKIDALTIGSAVFDKDYLTLNPNYPYNYVKARDQLRETAQTRVTFLRSQANRVKSTHPAAYAALTKKLQEVEAEVVILQDPEQYEELLLQVERVLDECEAQLTAQMKRDPKFWLVCPFISQADISLAILLFRLWQLGFESRMWSRKKRPEIRRYFQRMRKVRSFQKATLLDPPRDIWPYVLGAAGCILVFTIESFFRRAKP